MKKFREVDLDSYLKIRENITPRGDGNTNSIS